MLKLKTPVVAAIAAVALLCAAYMAWKTLFNPFISPPPYESGLPEGPAGGK